MTDNEDLKKVFVRYEKLLFKAANSVKTETPYSFVAEFSKKVDAASNNFKRLAKKYVDKAIPDVDMSEAAQKTLKRVGAFHETANVKLTTYVQMVSKLTDSAEQFKDRIQARITEDEKNGATTTVTDLKKYIYEELKTGSGIAVTYSNGTKMPTDKYAEMLARTTRTETQNIAMLGKALDDGNDLVECSTISPTCPTCAKYQGRIYSISGKTAGYPALYETAFKNGYSCIHPNCRHQFFPYNPKFHTAEERARLEKDTRRPMDEEKQSESARAAYARSQMQMRQWNKELNEFAKMQKSYAARGEEAPYKTLGAFRRAYRSGEGTLSYAKTHYMRRDMREFERFKDVIDKESMPKSLADFQQLKYNKTNQFKLLNHYGFARDNGKISALVSFKQFQYLKTRIENIAIGQTAANGTVIQSVSLHFVDRLIGTIYEKNKHEGMSLKDMQNILLNGTPSSKLKYDKLNKPSQNIEIKGVGVVTINPETGELIQCNKKTNT